MTRLLFLPIASDRVRHYQNGSSDYNGQEPELSTVNESGYPCRHCLEHIKTGDDMLLLAYRPFEALQPYAELGPIVLHADSCTAWQSSGAIPSIISERETIIIRGYDKNERIVGDTGRVIATKQFEEECLKTFDNPLVRTIHVRSSSNNCYFCKVVRG